MIILKTLKDLTLMRNILQKELPQSINVLGGVLHILNNNSCHLEMCVDSWPTFTAAICYRQKQVEHTGTKITYRLLRRGQLICVSACEAFQPQLWAFFFKFCSYTSLCVRKLLALPVSILEESHADLVDAHLPYGGSQESLNHVRACIRHLPNHCVRDGNGRPVSWMLSDELCELRMAYTLPEYRRAGHLLALSVAQICRVSSAGLPVYCHVNQQNQATIKAVTSLGFSPCPGMENISVLLICRDRV
ncbi:glycine N-acyltransferase-like protein Keg1 [Labrus mixtus]|uniref:glycine N-acyltransferase-like protein Keg1 n=1 Tax=Labrus mixtus TaxID=508554 RepID=UPI0029C00C92|nr:glycine N-acyltransferase-like protein Keg1 [Labrus mixtus]